MIGPGSTIGILGGGQLGRMTALAAAELGFSCHVFAPEPDSPAFAVARFTRARYDDENALDAFAASVDVVTVEFENIPVAALERLSRTRPVRPGPSVLAIAQDRLAEKRFLSEHGFPVTPFFAVRSAREAVEAARAAGGRAVLKTRRWGYDGRGQRVIASAAEAQAAFEALGGGELVLEAFVPFEREISVITARRSDGARASYPPVENRHERHILKTTTAPAPVSEALAREAVALAEAIAERLGVVGLLAVEMFVAPGDRLLVNELAPRPHNSGHWTQDACAVSQFQQLVRAICDLPLGDARPFAAAVMENLLGEEVERWPQLLAEPGARLHLYGKREVRPERKMGHVTRLRWDVPLGFTR
ncbi:MAG: 5-(carboxyamino)imidazole ribonucleotide synthase [Geminicoccaceae bacterium]|nr:5-(carboxyamino)imidazole ribonucleotide synthase [Geminicoccaceae bacterium]MCX7630267.1 5-(carboxyamino)imidazole ribonucleotide synthase [Geminicoccaceae bacterium]